MKQTTNYLLEEIEHNNLIIEIYRKICRNLNYFEHYLVFDSAVSGCVLTSAFASLVGVPVGFASSAVGMKICAITTRIKKYESIIKKKKKKHDKILLLVKAKFDNIEVLLSKALINSNISHDEFLSVNNESKESNEMKVEIKNPKNAVEYTI